MLPAGIVDDATGRLPSIGLRAHHPDRVTQTVHLVHETAKPDRTSVEYDRLRVPDARQKAKPNPETDAAVIVKPDGRRP